jgi:hypothetical protein
MMKQTKHIHIGMPFSCFIIFACIGDNLGGRFGVYIPIEIKEGLPIWIEPIFKVGKLGNIKQTKDGKEPLEFWQDNVEVGFNLAIAIPNFKASMKK